MTKYNHVRVPDFPVWLWLIFAALIIALTAPLAVKIYQSGEFQHACPSKSYTTHKRVPLELRNWKMYSGYLAYVNAFGWTLIAIAGVCLPFHKIRQYSVSIGVLGFFAVIIPYWLVCPG